MLVIISDLHLTDGSSGATISPGAFQLFAQELADLAHSASWRADGCYRPIDGIDLVLLGDVLDPIRSSRWLYGTTVRPWTDVRSPQLASFLQTVTDAILKHNEPALKVLRSLAAGGLRIPQAATRAGTLDATMLSLPVRIHYMVGNHDWFYHVGSSALDPVRATIIRQMGLANRANIPFPHDPAEQGELLQLMRRHRVFARHGDIFDPFNYNGDRDASSLGDAIVIELLNRFAVQVDAELGQDLPVATLLGLRELDNVRPLILAPVWIDGLLERTCPRQTLRTHIKKIWDRIADDFLALDFIRAQDTWNPLDLVDALQAALKFSQRVSLSTASKLVDLITKLQTATVESFYPQAMREPEFRNRRAKHIVYGHTHFPETVPLDASFAEGYVLNQVYFNSGTWRRVHRQTRYSTAEHEFIAAESMTYLAFFQGDERNGRPYETWTGTLGINPTEVQVHRVDAPSARRVPAPLGRFTTVDSANIAAPATVIPGPHFGKSAASVDAGKQSTQRQ